MIDCLSDGRVPVCRRIALVVGVGPLSGIGGACAKKMADEGYHVVMMGRTQATMHATLATIEADGGSGTVIVMASIGASAGFGVATSDMALMEDEVIQGFDVACGLGDLKFVCQNQGPNMPPPTGRDMREMSLEFITYMWEMNMGVSFVVGREAARRMTGDGGSGGTLIFTGATGAMRGKPPFIAFAQGKAGVRMLAQSMAREFAPQGLHVAHVIIDGGVGGSRLGDPNPFNKEGTDVAAAAEAGKYRHSAAVCL